MGARLCALAHDDPAFILVGALDRASPALGRASAPDNARGSAPKIADSTAVLGPSRADAVIDFSSDTGVDASIGAARAMSAALIVGTTALSDTTVASFRAESASRAVLVSANFSPGVTLLAALIRRAAAALPGYHASITEAHHTHKKDAPSGTALRLAVAAREGGADLPDHQLLSIRGGDVVGEHTVRFAGPGEYLELTHRATSRDLFARGALRAAAWIRHQPPGWYTMEDVLDLRPR